MSLSHNPVARERRRHMRIDDDIVLHWREVKPEEVPEELSREHEHRIRFPLASQMKLLSRETNELLHRIAQENALLAEYLRTLERKIDALARTLIAHEPPSPPHALQHVNLSATGLAFVTDSQIPKGVLLELNMILPPTLVNIVAYGRVVDSIPSYEHGTINFSMGVDFIRLRDRDRQLLIRHVARRQALFRNHRSR